MLEKLRSKNRSCFWALFMIAVGGAFSSTGALADELDGTLDVGELSVQPTGLSAFQRFEAGVIDIERAVQQGSRLGETRVALWTNPGTGPTGDLHATVLKELLEHDFHVLDLERSGRVSATFSDSAGSRTVAVAGSVPALLMFAPVVEADYLLALRIAEVVEETWKPLVPPDLESDWTAVEKAETAARDVYFVRLEAELIRTSGPDLCALWSIETTAETDEEAIHLAALALIEEVVR